MKYLNLKINNLLLMESIECNALLATKNIKSNQKSKKKNKTQINKCSKKDNLNEHKSRSNKNNNLIKYRISEKNSLSKEIKSNNICTYSPGYRLKLLDKFNDFLNKKKFKLSNNFDEKNSKKFLAKKDKYLERIIISDIIENNGQNNKIQDNIDEIQALKFKTQKDVHKYIIIITNYDEEIQKKTSKKKAMHRVKTYHKA